MEIIHFYSKKRILWRKKKAPAARALASKIKKHSKRLIITQQKRILRRKKSACGARTGLKNKKHIVKHSLLQQKKYFVEKKALAAHALAPNQKRKYKKLIITIK